MAGARFCWRERTERINWRMLRGLRLDDVLRRGDATLLEPYALHLTFARLPEVVAALSPSRHDDVGEGDARGDARNAWFIVRAMQLAMEYLLFLRVRDGAVVDSLRDELMACEKDCELLGERAKKWKERSRSGEKQADKLHQVLQGIAKLLQIEGATPSAVSTIESLLSDLVVSRRKHGDGDIGGRVIAPKQIQEARVCTLCGKMFSSNEYLEKHAIRRHPGREVQHLTPIKSSAQQPQEPSEVPGLDNQNNKRTSSSALELKQMLCAVEEMLQEHQETLRNVAREETGRIQNIYEQLHIETQLVEEMRAKRVAIEEEVMKHRHELEAIVQKKEAVIEELSVLNEQFEFLEQKKRIEVQGGGGHSNSLVEVDTSLHLELRRLEETITVLKDALATARDELTRLQDIYALLLEEKQALETQVHESRNYAQRLEATLRQQEEVVPVMKRDVGIQSTAEVATAAAQTTDLPDPSLQESPLILPPTHSVAGEVGVQTEHVDQVANLMDTMIQTDPVVETTPMADTRSTRDVGVDTEVIQDIQVEGYSGSPDANSIFTRHCSFVADEIERRAVRYAHGRTSELSKLIDFQSDKRFVSFPRRKFIRSRFLHDEHSVKSEIATRVAKLEHAMQRYGVQPKSSVLANEHVEVVQRAVHAHLEVLPAEALQKMVDIETMVNNLIKTEWMPQEKCRQEALESLTATLEMKSQRNQGLVRQAMAGFTTAPMVRGETSSLQSSSAGPARYASVEATQPVDSVLTTAKSESSSPITLASDLNAKTEIGTNSFAVGQAVQNATSIVLRGGDPDTVPPLPVIFEEQQQIIEERSPSPKSVQAIRKQTEGVRSVKVVSMSPNTSPPRHVNSSPRRAELQGQDANAGHSVDSNEVLPQPVNDISGSTTHGENELADLTERRHSSSHPSSFSAKHPESQLGIIIPSRYEAAQTRDYAPDRGDGEFSPSGLGDETDRGSSSNYSQIASSHDLRWSGSAGQSERVSEQSFSVVASSEVSLNASIPSLVSDGATSERGGEASKETIPHQQHAGESLHAESDEDASTGNRREALQEIIITNAIDFSEPNSQMTHDDLLPSEEAEETQPTVTNVSMENDVIAFDDSDIEEVLLG